jgi:hypothetical protein
MSVKALAMEGFVTSSTGNWKETETETEGK